MKNRIYYFTGTGNCLKAAQDIAARLTDCELIAIGSKAVYQLNGEYERIGFVFPVYYQGLPLAVTQAVKQINWSSQPNAYCFAVATYGAMAGNALPQLDRLIKQQSGQLHYCGKLIMFSNCVTLYNMSLKVEEITEKSAADTLPIREAIAAKQITHAPRFHRLVDFYYRQQIGMVAARDHGFHTAEACTGCGLCAKVCPVENILMANGKPTFQHQCEQCLACIQYCPTQALNYKNRTQKRRRYHHPAVDSKTLITARQRTDSFTSDNP